MGLVFGRLVRIVDGFSVSGLVVVLAVVLVVVVLVVVEPVGHFLPLEVNWPLEGRPEEGREGRSQSEGLDPLPRPTCLAGERFNNCFFLYSRDSS